MGTQPPPQKEGEAPNFRPMFIVPKRLDASRCTWCGGRTQPRGLCVRWGPSPPSPKRGAESPPQFSAHVCCSQTAGWIMMALGMEVGLGPSHIVLDGAPASLPNTEQTPQFSAHFYCRQTAGCIKMPLGMKVGLSAGDCVRWGPSFPSPKGAQPPIFVQCPLWPND